MFEVKRCLRYRDVRDIEMFEIERCLRWKYVPGYDI